MDEAVRFSPPIEKLQPLSLKTCYLVSNFFDNAINSRKTIRLIFAEIKKENGGCNYLV